MQVRYIRPFSQYKIGDVVEFPDGAAFDPFYLEPVVAEAPPAPDLPDITSEPENPADRLARLPAPALPYPAKEM